MPKGYWIARVDVADEERYKSEYIPANAEAFKKYKAKFVIRAGKFDAVEGVARSRNVVIEFPSYEIAIECYNSPEYAIARDIRQKFSEGELVIIEGYDD